MGIRSAEELLQLLQDPDELDRIAGELAEILPAPDPNDPTKPLVEGGIQMPQVNGQGFQPSGQQAVAPTAAQPVRTQTQGSPSIDFASALLGQGRS